MFIKRNGKIKGRGWLQASDVRGLSVEKGPIVDYSTLRYYHTSTHISRDIVVRIQYSYTVVTSVRRGAAQLSWPPALHLGSTTVTLSRPAAPNSGPLGPGTINFMGMSGT